MTVLTRLVIAFGLLLPLCSAEAKVRIMVGGIDKQIYLPAKLTEQLGYFKEEGLEVDLFNSNSGSQSATALLAREVDAVVGFYDHTIDLQSKGKFITGIVQLSVATGEVELVQLKDAAKLSNPANWKGQSLGVTGLGSATDFLTKYLAIKNGLKSTDITLIPVGAGDTFLQAIQQGKIVAGMTTEPTISRAVKQGAAKVAIDLRTQESTKAALGGDYPGATVYVSSQWLEVEKEKTQKLANAFVKTLKWMKAHSPEEIADKMPKDYYAGDKSLYVAGLKEGITQFSSDGIMPAGAPESVLRILSATNPEIAKSNVQLAKTYTTEFAKKANAAK